ARQPPAPEDRPRFRPAVTADGARHGLCAAHMSRASPWRSLTLRLTLLYMALFCGSVGVLLAALYIGGVSRPLAEVHSRIQTESAALAATYERAGRDELIRALERRAQQPGRTPYHVL